MSSEALPELRPGVGGYMKVAAVAGAIGILVCLLGLTIDHDHFFRAWLVAFNIVLGLALGSLVLLMLQYLVGGNWGFDLRRPLEAATRTLPLLTLFFVPLIFGLHSLYEWTHPEVLDPDSSHYDKIIANKAPYLNVQFFLIRAAIYFAVWNLLAFLLNHWSRRQDTAKSPILHERSASLSGPGIVLYAITITFASIDWVMSLEPHWYSTIFMAIFGMGQVLTSLVFGVAALLLLTPRRGEFPPLQTRSDLGSLMLAFIMVWAYLSFCQFLLIWSGNLPVEVTYYTLPSNRVEGFWGNVALALAVLHFFLPFFLLLNPSIKRSRRSLTAVALWVLAMRVVEMIWTIVPAFTHGGPKFSLVGVVLYPAALVGLGGLWLAFYLWQIQRLPLVPQYNPAEVAHGQIAHH